MDSFARAGLHFDVVDAGPADAAETVLLLHGFPQTAASWADVAPHLHAEGLRTLAPDQRGYSPGARPHGRRAYRVEELVDDAAALVDASGAGSVHVVGHDWGAVVAWMLAALRPELVRTVTAVSVPHPAAWTGAMLTSRQGLKSWYMAAFQLPGLAELVMGTPARMTGVLRRAGQGAAAARRDAEALSGRLTGPLNWYRALPFSSPGSTRTPVARPALQVWSDGDDFISRAAVDRNPAFCRDSYRLEVLPGVSHWIPDEAPGRLAALVVAHVRGTHRG